MAPSTFPFLRLPQEIRRQIYDLLLTANALLYLRQNHTPRTFEDTEPPKLLPGISYALAQTTPESIDSVGATTPYFNAAILLVCKRIFFEAATTLYRRNVFEIQNLTTLTAPCFDASIPLLPESYAGLVAHLAIQVHAVSELHFLGTGMWWELKRMYPKLRRLTLFVNMEQERVEEMAEIPKVAGEWLRRNVFGVVVKRDRNFSVPAWVDLRVTLPEDELLAIAEDKEAGDVDGVEVFRNMVKNMWEGFKRGEVVRPRGRKREAIGAMEEGMQRKKVRFS